jgi:hypothetical protein
MRRKDRPGYLGRLLVPYARFRKGAVHESVDERASTACCKQHTYADERICRL